MSDLAETVMDFRERDQAYQRAVEEMRRYAPVLERAEADPEVWNALVKGLGIATLAGFRAALAELDKVQG